MNRITICRGQEAQPRMNLFYRPMILNFLDHLKVDGVEAEEVVVTSDPLSQLAQE